MISCSIGERSNVMTEIAFGYYHNCYYFYNYYYFYYGYSSIIERCVFTYLAARAGRHEQFSISVRAFIRPPYFLGTRYRLTGGRRRSIGGEAVSRRRAMVPVGDKSSTGSSSAAHADNPKERLKECCRKLVAFMCTQVGVGGLVVGYAVVGAFCFIQIEGQAGDAQHHAVELLRHNCTANVWNATTTFNVFNYSIWENHVTAALQHFEHNLTLIVKKGYDGRTTEETWSFSAALMFSLSIFTMNGYGNVVPKTSLGKAATVVYAVFGIPLYVLYFRNMGKVLAQTFRWLYTWVYRCSMEDRVGGGDLYNQQLPQKSRVIVPSTACLWVLAAYVATGTVTFVTLEDWTYLDSTFFCVTSLCKIGIENFVPVGSVASSGADHPMKLVIKFVYLLLGMGIIAMCFDLMREDVQVRVRNLKMDIGLCFEDIRLRAVAVYRRRNSFD